MKFILPFLCLVQLLLINKQLFSQSPGFKISSAPSWITNTPIDYTKTSLDKYASDGYVDILYEYQVSLAEQSGYVKLSKKILSAAGVQNASEVSVSYDPSYQQLTFHTIYILRNGELINKLEPAKFKTVHQEEDLTHFIYNGTVNAFLELEDVRKNDVIEYSYTIKGFNPILKNKYSSNFSLEFSYPFYNVYYKLLVPAERKMNIKSINKAADPAISNVKGQQVYEWHLKDSKPKAMQDQTPSWYDPYAQVMVSEYASWKEVNDWAVKLFPVDRTLSQQVKNKIKEIESTSNTDEQKVAAVLRFVQDDIRYMGIEMGENSHKPADPSKVFAQRFGDCKEKSYLFCCMVRAMNIEASPVLINTVYKSSVNDMLPAPTVFDHATVRVKLGDSYYWYDPTIAYQRGDIKKIFYPDYQTCLVIADNTVNLSPIPFRNVSHMNVEDHFSVSSMNGEGRLVVKSIFKGDDADKIRSDYNNTSETDLMKRYQKFYAVYYDDIIADSLHYADNDSTGIFETTEYYTIPTFWKTDKESDSTAKKFSFAAFSINEILRHVKEKQRTMPIGLPYPVKFHEKVVIELPEEWEVTATEKHVANAMYAYNYRIYAADNIIYLDADYENLKSYVTVDEVPSYLEGLEFEKDFGAFEISQLPGVAENSIAKGSSKKGYSNLIGILLVAMVAGIVVWWSQRK